MNEKIIPFLENCYLEATKDHIFMYRIIMKEEKPTLLIYEVQCKPFHIWIYTETEEIGEDFVQEYIPELNEECRATKITVEEFNKILSVIRQLKNKEKELLEQTKELIEEVWTGQKSTET